MRPILVDQRVATHRGHIAYPTRKGKDVAIVVGSKTGRDKRTTASARLHHHRGIRYARHDAVTSHEVHLLRRRLAHVLRQQTTLRNHLQGRIPVQARIYLVQAMSQHAYGVHTIL